MLSLCSFPEKGYNATGIQEIADHVKVSKGSFYHHFKQKGIFTGEVLDNFSETLKSGRSLHRLKKFYRNKIDAVVNWIC